MNREQSPKRFSKALMWVDCPLQIMGIQATKEVSAIYDSSYIFLYTHISQTCTTIFMKLAQPYLWNELYPWLLGFGNIPAMIWEPGYLNGKLAMFYTNCSFLFALFVFSCFHLFPDLFHWLCLIFKSKILDMREIWS